MRTGCTLLPGLGLGLLLGLLPAAVEGFVPRGTPRPVPPPPPANAGPLGFLDGRNNLPDLGLHLGLPELHLGRTIGAGMPGLDTPALSASLSEAVAQLTQGSVPFAALAGRVAAGEVSLPDLAASLTSDPALASLLSSALTPWHAAAIAALAGPALVTAYLRRTQEDYASLGAPYLPGTATYSPAASDEFYAARPGLVLRRMARLALLTGGFNAGLLFDWLVLGKLLKDDEYKALRNAEPARAREALALCTALGPTFIKLGQALSIRTDLVPEAYALELRQLQDAVPPFDSATARDILRRELGITDLSEVFSELSDEPVASASIGQVYKGRLAEGGKEVAVKVQRPGILAEIALDLHVLRVLTPLQTTLQNLANGIKTEQADIDQAVALVDEWGRGFVAETDYYLEAENTLTFERAMRERGLDAVCAPPVVERYTRSNVLVTEWIDGTRLDASDDPDVPRLCGVAVNAYLTMLLDTGVLHCDPHPGNLLRSRDGRLVILDWGMTLEVPSDLQYALLEFIAHINTENFDELPRDFINLGFSPPDVSLERLQNSGITEGLSFAFRQLSAGGGPAKIQERVKAEFQDRYGDELSDTELRDAARAEMITRMEAQLESEGVDVKGVTNVMEEMSRRNRELFALPPYVLYVARAFSTLEGIGLTIDENYSIVQECYPYLASRLFKDRSPRAKKALRTMLGLTEDAEGSSAAATGAPTALPAIQAGARGEEPQATSSGGGLSPGKLIEMSEGFTSYTAATAAVDGGAGQAAAASEFAKLFLAPEGSTLQEILVDETAKLGDAATRQALQGVLVGNPAARATAAAFRFLPGPLGNAPDAIEELVSLGEEDERILATARELSDAIGPRLADMADPTSGDGRGLLSGYLADGASGVPSNPLPAVRSFLADEEGRKAVTDQLPGVANLGRRVGAGLLRRAAFRAERAPGIPEEARKALVDANTRLAEAIEPAEEVEKL